ncbi:MAG: hypothetical protein KGL29_14515 [Alphaproteobacteria bacterium]|nr:hypothetical protein [Alphaproteobacteria bacterium]MDE2162339.1 hypothetical protein [Alphaproteobacteria bacterium]MDE2267112.1 hypothetical protein [Alphaproteobacteria bacterium]MDE2501140.1 hypothetical protein [Alphaproteobacteria bacterium]
MEHLSNTLKTAALACAIGLGTLAATAGPALAHREYTRCDRDGDRCVRVICDNDGDDCRQVSWRDYDRRYDRDRSAYYRRDDNRYRHWVCDEDGDRCHWSYDSW